MKTNPLISICIPNYNYEKFIAETIKSVLNQSYQNFEIIICDNCSTDKSLDIINSFHDPRIKVYVNNENINLYENINNAISLSCGELFSVLHSDDFYEKNFLKTVIENYNKYPDKRVFVTGVFNYYFEKNIKNPHLPFAREGVISKQEVFIYLCKNNNIGNGANVVLHRECIEQAGLYSSNYRYASDFDFWHRLANHFDFVSIPVSLANYRIHQFNLSHTVNKNLDMYKEGTYIMKKSIKNNMNFSELNKQELREICRKFIYQRVTNLGIKYKSGQLIRKMLNFASSGEDPIRIDLVYRIIYFSSYILGENRNAFMNYLYKSIVKLFIGSTNKILQLKLCAFTKKINSSINNDCNDSILIRT